MTETPKPKVERQAIEVATVYVRRLIKEAAHRAGTCGCPTCKSEPRRLREWINTPPEKTE